MKPYAIDDPKMSGSLAPDAVKKRYKQLCLIEHRTRQARLSSFGPRMIHAMGVAFTLMAVLLGLAMVFKRTGTLAVLDVPTSLRDGIMVVPWLIGLATLVYLLGCGTYPRTWAELIDQELDAYDPVDASAYRNLQQRTRDAGYLDLDEVRLWVSVERSALDVANGRFRLPRRSFTDKKV